MFLGEEFELERHLEAYTVGSPVVPLRFRVPGVAVLVVGFQRETNWGRCIVGSLSSEWNILEVGHNEDC